MKNFFFFTVAFCFLALVGCADQNQKELQEQLSALKEEVASLKTLGISKELQEELLALRKEVAQLKEPAQAKYKKADNWHFVATEGSLYLATNKAVYRKVLRQPWVRTAMEIRSDSKIVSFYAVKRSNNSPILELNSEEWHIYIVMDSGNTWAFREGNEMDPKKIEQISMPE